ncbi:alpha/beta fold hydrolase [Rhodococcus sp. BP-349]|nr:alpha/beta fold hydrolase [Rhodococcus sp. BP-363]MBY6543169.1 alpha/beta fold hydrolase [Rhodococcus sp. BP-369]MBY6562399.1 alpha/beta fold hydrolase [Rhodococcus sp. BP-370]MBY6576691.1 alpha/beta fold hydrolase [Rhodococcus sp. BP-364]MBY6585992.1 alpha/beta fold hydrolase [Rhodococcus sp. BP-358]MBY6590329.1 alpha/beta fold hydrolase [Rhodococcus sp. BP-362]MBY6593138.1 alpha/beta fold hydrolase [Rhodococcus sp. BP-359]MBY6599005.1 alpha/beta fold hydrolase [Rhodococcus sp. BP-353]M
MAETSESCWAQQLSDLDRFDCYAVDLRGHGQSTVGAADGTLEQLGRDLMAFMSSISGPAVVVGFSMGATIALWVAAQPDHLISHVVAIGGSSVISRRTAQFFEDKARTVSNRELDTLHSDILTEVSDMFAAHPERASGYGHRRIAAIGEGDGYANAALAMARLRDAPLQPLLGQVTCPTDIVGGEHDAWCPRKAGDIIIEGLTHGHARYTEIAGVGHLMSVDDPRAVSSTIEALITGPPPAATTTTTTTTTTSPTRSGVSS